MVVEGVADLVVDRESLEGLAVTYEAKYPTGYPPDSSVYRVRPRVVFGLVEAAEAFTGAATRWNFDHA